MPGARELFSLNLAQASVGDFPTSIRQLSGNMEVVEKDGMKMLRASADSEFLITLPERLPDRFTLEFDLVTRAAGYNTMELAFEGTPTMNRSTASAYVSWSQGALTLFGGREAATNAIAMPPEVRAQIEGQLAEVRVEFAGDNFKMFVNGQRVYGASDLKFVRARVLRVGLGGIDSGKYAVHLARLRVADAATTSPVTAQQQSSLTSTSASGSNLMTPTSTVTPPTSTATPLAITGLTVSLNANGAPMVTWNPLPVSAEYFVVRWNVNDPTSNAMSPPGTPLTSPRWQDIILPMWGTYIYRVIARTANGTVEARTQYVYGAAPTPPSGVATVTPAPPTISVPTVTPPPTINYTTTSVPPVTPPPTNTNTPPGNTATGVPRTGTILSPEPPPPPTIPASSGPRTVTVMPPATTPTNPQNPAATTAPPSPGPGMPSASTPRYRVLLTGFAVAKATNDDPLAIDGKGEEAFAAAAVVNWNRQTSQMTSFSFVQTREYGDVSVARLFPTRIQAGSFSPTGGLAVGDRVPAGYDVTGASVPAPATDQFPLLVWEGELTAGVDSLVIAPSLWERDMLKSHFDAYRANWGKVSAGPLMRTQAVAAQYTTTAVSSALVAIDALTAAAPPAPTFSQPPSSGYKIAAPALGPGSDRPIGMSAAPGVLNYQERVVLITREKLYALNAGDGITIALPLAEPVDAALNGIYTLYLRVQRLQ